jgi:hypothetical protein
MATKKTKYPASIGACIDLLYENRAKRLEANKVVVAMKAEEAMLEDHILATFAKSELRGAKGDICTAAIKMDVTVNVTDWDKYLAYAVKDKAWDMLRKQPTVESVKARWADGKEVPGVEPFTKISLSLTKAGS